MDTFTASLRSDRRKTPEIKTYHFLDYQECREIQKCPWTVYGIDLAGKIVNVKITSVQTWKTRPEIRIGWKYGLYEYGKETVFPDKPQAFFCVCAG